MMKRISLFLITMFLLAGMGLNSQTPPVTSSAVNYSGLESKLKKSDADIQDPKKNIKAKTWTSRAQLLIDIFNIHNDIIRKGMDQNQVKIFLKEPKTVETIQEGVDNVEIYHYDRVDLKFRNGVLENWAETQKIHPDPLGESRKAIDEAVKINTDGKADNDIVTVIKNLKVAYETAAILDYENKDFKSSHANFIQLLDLNKQPLMKNTVDTIDIYYAGRAAFENKDYTEANRLFEEAAANNYNDPFLYVFRKQSYFASGDTANGVKVINEGFNKFPNDQSIMIELINYYLVSNQAEEALRLLEIAKANDPKNVSYTFAEGTLYEKMGRIDDAERSYKTCIEMEPEFINGIYNLGVLYYNKAVKTYEEASKISDNAVFEKKQQEGDEMLKKCIPYMEQTTKVTAKSTEDIDTQRSALGTLKIIYYRLKMDAEYQDVLKRLNQ
jgi:tetratricopeptide (TPR) repeat protein